MTTSSATSTSGHKGYRGPFGFYLGASWLWGVTFAMQSILFTTLMTHYLGVSAEDLGFAQSLILIPQVLFMLLGGVSGDRQDGRALLIRINLLAAVPPLLLALAFTFGMATYTALILYALVLGLLSSYGWPARDSMLTDLAPGDIQRAVTVSMGLFGASNIAGNWIGGLHESVGPESLLILQSGIFIAGVLAISRLPSMKNDAMRAIEATRTAKQSLQNRFMDNMSEIREGLVQVNRLVAVRSIILINFVSGMFNIGAWYVGFPIIVRDIYGMGPGAYAMVMIGFSVGQIITNFCLLPFLPVKHPGRFVLYSLVVRGLVLVLISLELPFFWFLGAVGLWGVNAGVAMTMTRSVVQESAPEESRARILSVFNLGFMGAAPLGALIMGVLISWIGVLNAVLAGPIVSLFVLAWGITKTNLWRYEHVEDVEGVELSPTR